MPSDEKKFESAIESLEDGYYEVDLAGNLVNFNQAMCDILGYDSSEMVGMNNRIFMDKDNAKKVFQAFKQVYETGKGCKAFDWQLIRKDGSVCHVDTSVSLLTGPDGDPIGFHGIARDITQQKNQALRMQQFQRLEALGTLAAGISHDFNNILSGIFGYAQLARTAVDNPQKTNEHIDQILNAAQRAAELVQHLLTFSRGTGEQKKPFRIYLIVKETMKLLRSSFPANIEMETRLESRQMVVADPGKIHQVITNLCLNAYQAMRSGGTLTVSLTDETISGPKQVRGREIPSGEYLRLSVADTGHGVDDKTLSLLTDPDAGQENTGNRGTSGLAVTKSIVDDHDGVMIIHSRPAKGTTVDVFLPRAGTEAKQNSEPAAPAAPVESFESGRKTIMLVDDEKAIRQIYEEYLKGHGYEVALFENGMAALNAFEADPQGVDMVITDMAMPVLTGDKLAQKMLEIRPDIPIVMWCGFSENISKDTAIQMGIRKYIQKPVSPRDLLQAVRRIFDEN